MSSESIDPEVKIPARHYAAFAMAIGWLRGAVYDAIEDDINKERLQRVLDATSTAEIARVLGRTEQDLAIDWNRYLTEAEKHQIGGDQE